MRGLAIGRALRPALPSLSLAADPRAQRLFVNNGDEGALYVFDTRSGALLRTVTINAVRGGRSILDLPMGGAGGIGAPMPLAVDERDNHLFTLLNNQEVMLNARSGAVLDAVTAEGFAPLIMDAADSQLVAPAFSIITLLDARTNAVRRILHIADSFSAVTVDAPDRWLVVASVATPGIIVSVYDARRLMLLRRLRVIRTYRFSPYVVAVPEAGRVFIYAGVPTGNFGTLFTFDVRQGTIQHGGPMALTDPVYTMAAASGDLLMAGGSGRVMMIDGYSGRLLYHATVAGSPVALALDTRRDRAFVLSAAPDNTWLTTLDTRTGRVVHRLALPASASALALDDRVGRLFVLDDGGPEQLPDPWRGVPGWVPRGVARWLPFVPRPGASTRVIPPRVLMLDEARLGT